MKIQLLGRFKKRVLVVLSVAVMAVFTQAQAAVITLNEDKMDEIFAQGNDYFFDGGIDIRFLNPITIFNSDLLSVDNADEWNLLKSSYDALANLAVGAFFVDRVGVCGSYTTTTKFTGCAGGWYMMLDSDRQAEATGYSTMAHEVGHNLGLGHVDRNDSSLSENLMWPYASDTKYKLTEEQFLTMYNSSRVQVDNDNSLFVNIQPILVAAEATFSSVPGPSSALLFLCGASVFGLSRRRKKSS